MEATNVCRSLKAACSFEETLFIIFVAALRIVAPLGNGKDVFSVETNAPSVAEVFVGTSFCFESVAKCIERLKNCNMERDSQNQSSEICM